MCFVVIIDFLLVDFCLFVCCFFAVSTAAGNHITHLPEPALMAEKVLFVCCSCFIVGVQEKKQCAFAIGSCLCRCTAVDGLAWCMRHSNCNPKNPECQYRGLKCVPMQYRCSTHKKDSPVSIDAFCTSPGCKNKLMSYKTGTLCGRHLRELQPKANVFCVVKACFNLRYRKFGDLVSDLCEKHYREHERVQQGEQKKKLARRKPKRSRKKKMADAQVHVLVFPSLAETLLRFLPICLNQRVFGMDAHRSSKHDRCSVKSIIVNIHRQQTLHSRKQTNKLPM